MAEARRGDGQGIEPRLPRREDLTELVLESGRAGSRVDEDGAGRTAKQHSLAVADREDTCLWWRTGPNRQSGARDDGRRQDRGGESCHAAAVVDVTGGDDRTEARVIGHSGPGRKPHHRKGRGGQLREDVGDLFHEEEQTGEGHRSQPGQLGNEG